VTINPKMKPLVRMSYLNGTYNRLFHVIPFINNEQRNHVLGSNV